MIVGLGCTVTLRNAESGEVIEFTVVSPAEADIKRSHISVDAPLAQAMLAHAVGDAFTLQRPRGSRTYEIVKIEA